MGERASAPYPRAIGAPLGHGPVAVLETWAKRALHRACHSSIDPSCRQPAVHTAHQSFVGGHPSFICGSNTVRTAHKSFCGRTPLSHMWPQHSVHTHPMVMWSQYTQHGHSMVKTYGHSMHNMVIVWLKPMVTVCTTWSKYGHVVTI